MWYVHASVNLHSRSHPRRRATAVAAAPTKAGWRNVGGWLKRPGQRAALAILLSFYSNSLHQAFSTPLAEMPLSASPLFLLSHGAG